MKSMTEYDYTILKLAQMTSCIIAKEQKISKIKAYLKFMTSKTGEMLFEPSTGLWFNGPDYLADEYKREMYFKKHKVPMD